MNEATAWWLAATPIDWCFIVAIPCIAIYFTYYIWRSIKKEIKKNKRKDIAMTAALEYWYMTGDAHLVDKLLLLEDQRENLSVEEFRKKREEEYCG